ncbi:hypothetical protein SAMN02744784_03789 [Stenotrophomonas sp. CC120223-11]|nr:hypothetical protein SAMN02744786_2880 [Stenotrophomonas sp. CC120222-04]SNY75620.1 hypothetical protein SAMN02744784_03789 [Stenotrophomonas sp. CC120223-11]
MSDEHDGSATIEGPLCPRMSTAPGTVPVSRYRPADRTT